MERKSSCCSGRSYATRVASPPTKNEAVTPKRKPVARDETLAAPKEEKVDVKQDIGSSFTEPVAPSLVVPAATSVKKEVDVKQDIGSSFTAPVAPSLAVPAGTTVKKEEQMEVAAGFDDDCC